MRGTKLTNRGRPILCHPNPINAISLHLLVHNSIPLSPPQLALAQSAALFPAAMGVRPPPPYHAEERGMPPPQYLPPAPEPWFSWLVPVIFLANIAMFVLSMYVNDCPAKMNPERCLFYEYLGPFSFQPFNENPLLGPSAATLKGLGALEKNLVVKKNETWRLLSCMWFHAGVIHLAVNMMSLLFIGIRLEQEFGFLRIGILYVLSGFGGSLMSALASTGPKPAISVGASGALFGLLGAMLSELITNWSLYANKCAALVSLVFIICLNLAVGFLPHVDNSAHIGGFLSGILLGFILLFRPQYGYVSRRYIPAGYEVKHKKPKYKCYQHLFWAVSLVLLLLGYIIGLSKLFRGETIGQKHIGIFIHP